MTYKVISSLLFLFCCTMNTKADNINGKNLRKDETIKDIKTNIDEETRIINEHNAKNRQQKYQPRTVNDKKGEEEKENEDKAKNNEIEKKKEINTLLNKGVSGDELVGIEFTKWSTAKAKMTSKEFRNLVLENRKMKKILSRLYTPKMKETQDKKQPIAINGKSESNSIRNKDVFFIYGNYEDEEGELAGDLYTKWSGIKAKTTAKQFRSLVERTEFLQLRVRQLMAANKRLNSELLELKLRLRRRVEID